MADDALKLAALLKESIRTASLYGEEDFMAGAGSSDDPKSRLDALCKRYENCQNCRLGATRKKFVFGVGSPRPKALFIGEGPGYEEDRQGIPFVGKAGQLLDRIMAAIGLDRTNAYIANMVKCHPMRDPANPQLRGNDRPPEFDEMAACREILNEQLRILEPPVICALGATAAKGILNTHEGITRLRGRVFQYRIPGLEKTVPLIPTYHPAALLRNEALKKDVWEDMKLLRDIMNGKVQP